MTRGGLLRRLQEGGTVDHRYARGELRGLLSGWRHEGRFVLTWEEVQERRSERRTLRDQRQVFATAEELLAFLEQQGFTAHDFAP